MVKQILPGWPMATPMELVGLIESNVLVHGIASGARPEELKEFGYEITHEELRRLADQCRVNCRMIAKHLASIADPPNYTYGFFAHELYASADLVRLVGLYEPEFSFVEFSINT